MLLGQRFEERSARGASAPQTTVAQRGSAGRLQMASHSQGKATGRGLAGGVPEAHRAMRFDGIGAPLPDDGFAAKLGGRSTGGAASPNYYGHAIRFSRRFAGGEFLTKAMQRGSAGGVPAAHPPPRRPPRNKVWRMDCRWRPPLRQRPYDEVRWEDCLQCLAP